ncbi:hypothetical protein PARMER_03279 [Parabacteroides merdae ATCC 43184]|nr:hypothetical protein PARMER_03279 [Parabacteroides merdae ATCC 43184]
MKTPVGNLKNIPAGVFWLKMDEFILFCSRFALSLQIIRQKIEG